MKDFKQIKVTLNGQGKLNIKNPTGLPLVGKGGQGAVFRLDEEKCVKIHHDEKLAEAEQLAYQRTIGSPIMPKLYEIGPKYLVIEYIKGPSLKEYLLGKRQLPKELVQELINMFVEMKRLGFVRKDLSLRHIILKDQKTVKVIDHAYTFILNDPYPIKFFKQLKESDMLNAFITQGQELHPSLFREFRESLPNFFCD